MKKINIAKMNIAKMNIAEPYFDHEEIDQISEVLRSKWVTQGSKTEAFEKDFARYHQVQHGIAVTSCTTGLELVLRALGIGDGDEVIIPSLSWVATANAVQIVGAKAIFVDVEKSTCNLNLSVLQNAISPKTKAIIPVHLFGRCIDIQALKQILPAHIYIIEDAACATGATNQNGRYCGQDSHAAVFSFHPRKVITTGEGGMILVNDAQLTQTLRQMRNHGQATLVNPPPDFQYISDVDVLGFNYRMTDIQAAMGLAQLKKLDFLIKERNKVAHLYLDCFKDMPSILLPPPASSPKEIITWQSFVILLAPHIKHLRNACMAYLQANGIQTRPATHCIPRLSYYFSPDRLYSDFEVADEIFTSSISLPLLINLCQEDIDLIKDLMLSFFQEQGIN
jgi:perosamine synthetase